MPSFLKGDLCVLTPRLDERRTEVVRSSPRASPSEGRPRCRWTSWWTKQTQQGLKHEDVRTCTIIDLAVSKVAHVVQLGTHMQCTPRKQERTNH